MVIRLTYNLFIRIYGWLIKIGAIFNSKAKLWIEGRTQLLEKISKNQFEEGDWIWIHCASLGEFEQGRPVIESLKKSDANIRIILTFFSPSGFEKRKNYKYADQIFYLPLDTKSNAEKFVNIIKPKAAIFVRYEFWINHLNELFQKEIPVYLISASFRKKQLFFKPIIGSWFRKILHGYSNIYTIDSTSKSLLESYGIKNVVKSGDTRADRVIEIMREVISFEKIESFKSTNQLIVGGSIWMDDVKIIIDSMKKTSNLDIKWVLAPHEIGDGNLKSIEKVLSDASIKSVRYTDDIKDGQVLIIDNIGMLSRIYKYADLVYIGGGFGKGIHNVLEPGVFGNIVLFGPNYKKFPEAIGLINSGAAFPISNRHEATEKIDYYLQNEDERKVSEQKGIQYINGISGATDAIVKEVKKQIIS